MDIFIEPIGRLINEFSKLPGVGKKTAQRYAYRIINMSESDARAFADAIVNVKRKVRYCKVCGNFTEEDVCEVCRTRDKGIICVVKEPKGVAAIEKLHEFKGVYHVLHGVIDPMEGVGPNDIRSKELLARIQDRHVSRAADQAARRDRDEAGARHTRGVGDRIYRRRYADAGVCRAQRALKKEGKKMKISVLGCGRWGSFIAWYLCNKGYDVCSWGPEGD